MASAGNSMVPVPRSGRAPPTPRGLPPDRRRRGRAPARRLKDRAGGPREVLWHERTSAKSSTIIWLSQNFISNVYITGANAGRWVCTHALIQRVQVGL